MEKELNFIHKELASVIGSRSSTGVTLTTHVSDGETEIVLSHKISLRLPLNKHNYKQIVDSYNSITKSSGGSFVMGINHIEEFIRTGRVN